MAKHATNQPTTAAKHLLRAILNQHEDGIKASTRVEWAAKYPLVKRRAAKHALADDQHNLVDRGGPHIYSWVFS